MASKLLLMPKLLPLPLQPLSLWKVKGVLQGLFPVDPLIPQDPHPSQASRHAASSPQRCPDCPGHPYFWFQNCSLSPSSPSVTGSQACALPCLALPGTRSPPGLLPSACPQEILHHCLVNILGVGGHRLLAFSHCNLGSPPYKL